MACSGYRYVTSEQIKGFGGSAYKALTLYFELQDFTPEEISIFVNTQILPSKKIEKGDDARAMMLLGRFLGSVAATSGSTPRAAWIPTLDSKDKDTLQWFLCIDDSLKVVTK